MKLQDLIEKSEQLDSLKHDFNVLPSQSGFKENKFVVSQNGAKIAYGVEDHALGQIATRFNIPVSYLRRCLKEQPQLSDTNLNTWMWASRAPRENKMFVRTHGDDVRAFLSHAYAPIGNTETLRIAEEMLGDSRYSISDKTSHVSRDKIYIRISIIDTGVGPEGGNYGFGAFIGNSEIGDGSLVVAPYIQRTSCTNSIIISDSAWKQRHVWHTTAWLRGGVKENLGTAFRVASDSIEKLVAAEESQIEDLSKVIDKLVKKHKLSVPQHDAVMIGTEGKHTLLGVINGITWMAQSQEQDERVRFEMLAGELLESAVV